jgi:hypothetical protein
VIHLDFWGNPLEVILWLVLMSLVSIRISLPPAVNIRILSFEFDPPWILGTNPAWLTAVWMLAIGLALAGPWILEAACRRFCRALRFSDDSRALFSGKGVQIYGWWIIWLLSGRRWSLLVPEARFILEAALFFLGFWSTLQIVRWFVSHVEWSTGRRLAFTGHYRDLLAWEVLLALSIVTVIGWAWVLAAMWRWLAASTSGAGAALVFHGQGGQILWRTLAAIVFSVPVVTIPWAWLWYARWLVQSTTLEGQLAEASLPAA